MKFPEYNEQWLSPKIIRPEKLFGWGKLLIFILLFTVCVVVAVANRNNLPDYSIWVIVAVELALITENAIKMWALRNFKHKIVCYVIDSLLLLVLTYFTNGSLISTLYVIILSEFYLSQEKLSGNIAMGVSSVVLFIAMFGISSALRREGVDVWRIVSNSFNDFIIFTMHFLIINFTLLIYRKNTEIEKALDDLNETNRKLREAYYDLQAVTALEERQRIAKDIHDTAGHSITTVIMQTEAAKLVIDSDPEDAKRKIAAANLQAKHALEELRESVHLLSGVGEKRSLRDELLQIVHESTDGTNIAVRYEVDDIKLCDAKNRFICNTLKEGISNGLRHGNATAFYFELKEGEDRIEFLLSDNGSGIDTEAFKEGFGLTGMRRRAESLGGSVWFETEPDEGFEIHLTLPPDPKKAGRSTKKGKEI